MTETVHQEAASGTRVSIYEVGPDGDTQQWCASGFLVLPKYVCVHPHQAEKIHPEKRLRVAIQYLHPATHPVEMADVHMTYRRSAALESGPDDPAELVVLQLDRDASGPTEPWLGAGTARPVGAARIPGQMLTNALSHPPLPDPASLRPALTATGRPRPLGCDLGCWFKIGKCKCPKKKRDRKAG